MRQERWAGTRPRFHPSRPQVGAWLGPQHSGGVFSPNQPFLCLYREQTQGRQSRTKTELRRFLWWAGVNRTQAQGSVGGRSGEEVGLWRQSSGD